MVRERREGFPRLRIAFGQASPGERATPVAARGGGEWRLWMTTNGPLLVPGLAHDSVGSAQPSPHQRLRGPASGTVPEDGGL